MSLITRQLEPEIMDDPALDEARHLSALRGLRRLNRVSGSAGILWAPIRRFLEMSPRQACRVLDIATGAGDIPIELWRRARRAGVSLHVAGCDKSPRAVAYARQCAVAVGIDAEFFTLDALSAPIPPGYDIIISSLFLHHLDEEQAVQVLQGMARATGRLVLVHDLVRRPAGLALAYVGTRLCSASPVVRHDGPQSVRAAFTLEEVSALARRAGLVGATVVPRWPCRYLLIWRRP